MDTRVAGLREQLRRIEAGFVGRDGIMARLMDRIIEQRDRQALVAILAPPFLGKTTLLRNLETRCRECRDRMVAFVPGAGVVSEENFYGRIYEQFLVSQEGGWIIPPTEWRHWERFGEEVMREISNELAVLLIDDFDDLARYRSKLVAHLRAQLLETAGLTTIISLSTSGAELLTDQRHPLYGAASEIIRLEPLDKPACLKFWQTHVPESGRWSAEQLETLYDEIQGEPVLLKACARTMVIGASTDPQAILVSTAFELSPFYSAWLAQLPGQQRVILEKLAGHPDQLAPALARESGVRRTVVSTQLQRLQATGHVVRKDGHYRLRPLWQFWFKRRPEEGNWGVTQ